MYKKNSIPVIEKELFIIVLVPNIQNDVIFNVFNDTLTDICSINKKHILLDFKEVNHLYSRSIGLIVRTKRILSDHNKQLALVNVTKQIKQHLDLVNVLKIIPALDSIKDFFSLLEIDNKNNQQKISCLNTVINRGTVTIVTVKGEMVDFNRTNPFHNLEEIIENTTNKVIIIDCKSIIKLSVEALYYLVKATNSLKKRGGKVILASVNYITKEIFEMLEIEDTFKYAENVEDGIKKC